MHLNKQNWVIKNKNKKLLVIAMCGGGSVCVCFTQEKESHQERTKDAQNRSQQDVLKAKENPEWKL